MGQIAVNNYAAKNTRGAALAALRRRVAAIEQGPPRAWRAGAALRLGVSAIDEHLPGGGLTRGGLHEILGDHGQQTPSREAATGAALAFTAVLAGRRAALSATSEAAEQAGRVLWCPARTGLYGPGLAAFGLAPEQLILVQGRDDQQRLWAMEEGLKCAGLAMVVGEVGRLDLGQSRRLQLAAENSGVTALLLQARGDDGLGVSAALTRWRITAAPSAQTNGYAGIGAARCRVELLRCKGGRPGQWLLQWNGRGFEVCTARDAGEEQYDNDGRRPAADTLPMAAPVADGSAVSRLATGA